MTCIGLAGSLVVWLRGDAAAGAFAALFALAGLAQGATLLADTTWPLPADAELLADGALLGAALAGLFALRALRRTSRELERAEDLHWDSMELIRSLRELGAQVELGQGDRLARLLELGAARFGLDHALLCRAGERSLEVLAWRAPHGGLQGSGLAAALEPLLRRTATATQPLASERSAPAQAPPALRDALAAPVPGTAALLAFAGRRSGRAPFTATDKDLVGLLAEWLRGEPSLRVAEPAQTAKRAAPAPARAYDDLNGALRRLAPRLQGLVGADARLELALAESLPALRPQRIRLEALIESLVVAAHGLAVGGALRIETALLPAHGGSAGAAAHVTLALRVRGAVDPAALARAFDAPSDPAADPALLPLAQVESLLRRAGGDLSAQVEPGRGALLTAFLPGAAQRAGARARSAPVPPPPSA